MNNNLKNHFLILMVTIVFIQCSLPKRTNRETNNAIVGLYVNKIKTNHFKDRLELFKYFTFFLSTTYEWNKYEYSGTYAIKKDTLILIPRVNSDTSNKEKFAKNWLIKFKEKELVSLENQDYSLVKSN